MPVRAPDTAAGGDVEREAKRAGADAVLRKPEDGLATVARPITYSTGRPNSEPFTVTLSGFEGVCASGDAGRQMLACFTFPAYHLMMLENDLWQDAAIGDLVALLRPDEDVRAAALSGSCAQPQAEKDVWSDVDVLVVVREHALGRFFPDITWLQPLGEVYAYEQNSNELTCTTRICFKDFRRLDMVLTTEPALGRIDTWGMVSFWKGTRTLFSRSPLVNGLLARKFAEPSPPLISPEQFQAMANHFWFKAALAVTKVARDDLLLALHLALDLVRDCCVLGMLLRDRAEGTSHHRHGGMGNEFVARLRPTGRPFDAAGLLDMVEQSGISFDKLAAQWSTGYRENRQPLLAAINRARRGRLDE